MSKNANATLQLDSHGQLYCGLRSVGRDYLPNASEPVVFVFGLRNKGQEFDVVLCETDGKWLAEGILRFLKLSRESIPIDDGERNV